MNINIHIDINMDIDITPPPHPMLPPRRLCGRPEHVVGVGWGDINIHIDINMNIDIHIITNMNVEYYISYYTLLLHICKEQVKTSKETMNLTIHKWV